MRKNFKIVQIYWKFYLTTFVSFVTILVAASLFNALPTFSGTGWIVNLLFTLVFLGVSIVTDIYYFRLNPIFLRPADQEDRNWCYAGILLPAGSLIATIMVLLSDSPLWAILPFALFLALAYRWKSVGGKQTRESILAFKKSDEKEYKESVRILTILVIILSFVIGFFAFINGHGWFACLIIIAGFVYWQWKKRIFPDIYQPGHLTDKKEYPDGYVPKRRTSGIFRAIVVFGIVVLMLVYLLPIIQNGSAGIHNTMTPTVVTYSTQPANTASTTPSDDGASTPTPSLPTPTPTPVIAPDKLPVWTGNNSFGQTVNAAMDGLSTQVKLTNDEMTPAIDIMSGGSTLTCNAVTDERANSSIQIIDGSNPDPTTGIAWCPTAKAFAASATALNVGNPKQLQAETMIAVARWWLLRQHFHIRPGFTAFMAGAILKVMGENSLWVNALAAELPAVNSQNTYILNGYASGATGLQSNQ